MKQYIKKAMIIGLVLAMFLTTSCKLSNINNIIPGTNNSVQQFLDSVDQNNVSEAKQLYEDKISDNQELKEKVNKELISRLEKAISDYNNGLITDSEAIVIFETISNTNVLSNSDISPLRNKIEQLIASKSAYNSAEALFNSGDYCNAYQQYLLVIADDTNYSSAVSKASKASDLYVSSINEQIETFIGQNDYVNAITTVRYAVSILPNNQSLKTSQTTLEAEYLRFVLDKANTVHNADNNYEEAIKIIKEAQTVLNDASLDEALTYYQSFIPKDLFSIEKYSFEESTYCVRTDEWKPGESDVFGVSHGYGQRIIAWDKEKEVDEYFNIPASNLFTGTIVPGSQFEKNVPSNSWYNDLYAIVYIYGDNKLLYTSPQIKCDTKQIDFSLDITGVTQIRIYVVINGYYSYADPHYVEIGLVDFFIKKTLKK